MEFSAVQWLVLVILLNQVSKTKSSFISAGGLIMFQLDSQGFWIPRRGFPIPGTGLHSLQWNLDCSFQWLVGFWIP